MGEVVMHYEWDDAHLSVHPVVSYENKSLSCDDSDVDFRETINELADSDL